jgi:glycosyltransferase involved in cell wall biosynthesis
MVWEDLELGVQQVSLKILCVSEECPWPEVSGFRVRLSNVLRALGELGEVDCFLVLNDGRHQAPCSAPPDSGVARLHVVRERAPTNKLTRLARWLTSKLPLGLLWRRWTNARSDMRRWRRHQYDLVWFAHVDGFVALHDLVNGPRIVDLDNLEDQRLQHRRRAVATGPPRPWLHRQKPWPQRLARHVIDRYDVRRWERLQRHVAGTANVVTVCSELDRRRLGVSNAAVLRNGYELTRQVPRRTRQSGRAPTLTMVGVFTYEPNYDGAWWFVDEVLPRLRDEVPAAGVRLVGAIGDEVEALRGRPGVTIVGLVDDIDEELARTDVEIVPIRSGGGTRVKVIEAFAHRVPVVSTQVGSEGLEVSNGVHLLVADEPRDFAAACALLLRDDVLRERLTEEAYRLYSSEYRWSELRPIVAQLAKRVAAEGPRAANSTI